MKKIIGSLILMLVVFASVTAMAEESGNGWTLSDDGVLRVTMEEVDLDMYMYRDNIKSIVIEEGAKSIRWPAFSGLDYVTSISFPSTVTDIYEDFADDCESLSVITVAAGNTVYSSQDGMLMNADKTILLAYPPAKKNETFTVPSSVTAIQAYISNPYLKKLVLHAGVELNEGISHCTALEEVQVAIGNPYHKSVNGILYNKDMSELEAYPAAKKGDVYVFPDTVTTIGWGVFARTTNLKKVEIPQTVTNIGDGIFYRSSVEEVRLPDGITEVGESMFYGCTQLKNVYIPEGVTKIGEYAFCECKSLKNIDFLPSTVTEIGQDAFSECTRLETVIIPQNVETLGREAFYGCNHIEKVVLSSKITEIPAWCFSDSVIEELYIPEGVKKIDGNAFDKNILVAYLPRSLEEIGRSYQLRISDIYYSGTKKEWTALSSGCSWQWENLYCLPEAVFGEITSEPSETGYKITAGLENVYGGGKLIAAVYDGDAVVYVVSETLEDGEESHCVDVTAESGYTVKLFLWDSLQRMIPLCGAQEITLE